MVPVPGKNEFSIAITTLPSAHLFGGILQVRVRLLFLQRKSHQLVLVLIIPWYKLIYACSIVRDIAYSSSLPVSFRKFLHSLRISIEGHDRSFRREGTDGTSASSPLACRRSVRSQSGSHRLYRIQSENSQEILEPLEHGTEEEGAGTNRHRQSSVDAQG